MLFRALSQRIHSKFQHRGFAFMTQPLDLLKIAQEEQHGGV